MDQRKSLSDNTGGGYVDLYSNVSSPFDILSANPDYTLVIATTDGNAYAFSQRGVNDLLWVYDNHPEWLLHSTVADKIVGKAAAAFMILGGIDRAQPIKVSEDALNMFLQAGIECQYQQLVPYVENRTRSGRCPIDTLCADLTDPTDMIAAARGFIAKMRQSK